MRPATLPAMRLIAALLAAALAVPANAAGLAQLLPAGEFAARDGRPGPGKTWRVTDAQGQALAVAMNAAAQRNQIAIDYDHQTLYVERNGAKAPAAGWITRVEWRDGRGLYASVDWTPAALAHINAGEYRYISPLILFDADTGAVSMVLMASLLNTPALVGMDPVIAALAAFTTTTPIPTPILTPIPDPKTSTENYKVDILAALIALLALPGGTDQAAVLAHITTLKARADAPPKATLPAALATALGLAPGADEAAALSAALSAVAALKTPDATTLQTMQAMQGQIAALTAQINGSALAGTIDKALADGYLLPAQKDWATNLGTTNMAALNAYLATAPALTGLAGQSGGKEPIGSAAALSADAEKMRQGFGLSAEQWAKGASAAAH